jgi:hypothetical protein
VKWFADVSCTSTLPRKGCGWRPADGAGHCYFEIPPLLMLLKHWKIAHMFNSTYIYEYQFCDCHQIIGAVHTIAASN